jgi:AmmeMemoRadiSam system protein B
MTSSHIRPAAVAGSFYPADAEELSALLDDCFNLSPLGPGGITDPNRSMIAGMVPHAGPIYSGPCAAHLYCQLDPYVRRVVLLGVNHRGRGHKAALSPWTSWQSPLGEVVVDDTLSDALEGRVKFLKRDAEAHAGEHSIEIQMPFLQRVLRHFELVPVSLSHLSIDECAQLGGAIAELCKTSAATIGKTVILASTDLSHYLSPRKTDALDRLVLEQVLGIDPEGLLRTVEDDHITMCGALPTAVMLFAARALGCSQARLLKHCHSGNVTPMRQVVGYASVAFEL